MKSRIRLYGLSLVGWTVFGLFFFSQDAARIVLWRQSTPLGDEFLARMTAAYILALLTPAVLKLGGLFRIERGNWPRMVAVHFGLAVVFSFIELALETVVYLKASILAQFVKPPFGHAYMQMLPAGFHDSLVIYWLLIGAEAGARFYRRYREQEKTALMLRVDTAELKTQLVASRLSALKMQLQPHFLFNTLNAITVLIRQGRSLVAEEMLTRLSDLLRAILDDAEAQEIPLRRELACVKLYLEIEKVRFGERLTMAFSIAPETLDAAVPHMSLQPLVENAVRHGVGKRLGTGKIDLSARRIDGILRIRIADNGPGPGTSASIGSQTGIGLANTRARLRQLYGDAGLLKVEEGEPCGAVVTVEIPYRPLRAQEEQQRIEVNEV